MGESQSQRRNQEGRGQVPPVRHQLSDVTCRRFRRGERKGQARHTATGRCSVSPAASAAHGVPPARGSRGHPWRSARCLLQGSIVQQTQALSVWHDGSRRRAPRHDGSGYVATRTSIEPRTLTTSASGAYSSSRRGSFSGRHLPCRGRTPLRLRSRGDPWRAHPSRYGRFP